MENVVQNEVGHADWGMYSALLSFSFLFVSLSDWGINQYSTKTLASQPELLKSYFPNLLSFKILLSLLYPILMIGIGILIGYKGRELAFLGLLCLMQGGIQLVLFFRANFQASQMFKIDGVASVFERALLLAIVGGLLYYGIKIETFVYTRLIAVLASIALFYGAIVYIYGWLKPRFEWNIVKEILRKSFPFAMITIVYSLHDKVDQVMLERLYSKHEAGLYAGAYRWLDAFSMYLWTIMPIFFAKFAFHINDLHEKKRLLQFGQVVAAIPLIYVSIFTWFYGEKLLWLFDKSSDQEVAVMLACLQALFVAAYINSIFSIFSTLLTSTNHERFVSRMVAISICINIALNFIFIPEYGAFASAWTTVISYLFLSITYIVYIQRQTELDVPYIQMGKILLASIGLAAAFYGLIHTSFPWFINSAIAGIVFLICAFILGLHRIPKIE